MAVVDIVIPVYNQASKLIKCLESLKKQTFQDFTIIIVDDASTDGIQKILEAWLRAENLQAKKCQNELSTKTKILKQEHRGAAAARNFGTQQALAEYILFCDADLTLSKQFLKISIDTLQNNRQVSFCYTSFKYGWKKFKLFEYDIQRLKEMPYIHTTSLIRRKDFPGFDENIRRFQDWDLWLTMAEQGHIGIWIPNVLFKVHPGGTISKWVPKFFIRYFTRNKRVKDYNQALEIIKKKHRII